jgi:hypothetical protein
VGKLQWKAAEVAQAGHRGARRRSAGAGTCEASNSGRANPGPSQ